MHVGEWGAGEADSFGEGYVASTDCEVNPNTCGLWGGSDSPVLCYKNNNLLVSPCTFSGDEHLCVVVFLKLNPDRAL